MDLMDRLGQAAQRQSSVVGRDDADVVLDDPSLQRLPALGLLLPHGIGGKGMQRRPSKKDANFFLKKAQTPQKLTQFYAFCGWM